MSVCAVYLFVYAGLQYLKRISDRNVPSIQSRNRGNTDFAMHDSVDNVMSSRRPKYKFEELQQHTFNEFVTAAL